MSLEKTIKEDKIEVINAGDWKVVQIRTATIISEDGAELNRSLSRSVINPTDDWSDKSAEVKAICDVVHTDATIAAYNAAQQAGTP